MELSKLSQLYYYYLGDAGRGWMNSINVQTCLTNSSFPKGQYLLSFFALYVWLDKFRRRDHFIEWC